MYTFALSIESDDSIFSDSSALIALTLMLSNGLIKLSYQQKEAECQLILSESQDRR
jgi:hypothetical protein